MHIINLGFDLENFQENELNRTQFRNEFNLENDHIAIGIVGRLTHIKDHNFFVDAAKNVISSTSKSLKFFIIGDGEERENIESYIRSLEMSFSKHDCKTNLNALFQFLSWRKDMDCVYAGLDIVALTSKNEGTPVTLIEAQAASKTVISTDVGGVKDILIPNISGYVPAKDDLDSFSENLLKLIENDEERIIMGKKGYEFVNSNFSYKRLVNDIKNLYQSLEA